MSVNIEVHRLSGAGQGRPVVVAVHGITANGLSFGPLAAALPERDVWAPDLRGRACSRDVGPAQVAPGAQATPGGAGTTSGRAGKTVPDETAYGLDRHADDLAPVLRQAARVGGGPPVLLGHSMGAFVSAIAAARHPELVSALVLVDGGLAFPVPQTVVDEPDAAIRAVIGPAMTRLSMAFDSRQAYLQFWAAHPAVGELSQQDSATGELVRSFLLHDLVRRGEQWVSSCRVQAVREDGAMTLTDPEAHGAVRAAVAAGVPATLVWAPRGLMNEEQGLYDEHRLTALDLPDALQVHRVDDTNHYTVLLAEHGAHRLAEVLRGGTPQS